MTHLKNNLHEALCRLPWRELTNELPKNIFQTFESHEISGPIAEAMQTWKDLNPTWRYHFFTANARRAFIKHNFHQAVLDAYDALIPGSYQADLWRFAVLYIHGGVYADHKVILLRALDDFVPSNTILAAYKDSDQQSRSGWFHAHYVLTGILMAQPQHLVFLKAIECIVHCVSNNDFGHDPLCPTGPGLLGKAFNLVLGYEPDAEIKAGEGMIEGRPYQLFPCPYDVKPPEFAMFGMKDCFALYHSYRDASIVETDTLQRLLKSDYAVAWFLGKIYAHDGLQAPQNAYAKKRGPHYLRRKIRSLLKQGHKNLASTLILGTLKLHKFQPKIWWYAIKCRMK